MFRLDLKQSSYYLLSLRNLFPKPYPMEWVCLFAGSFLIFYYSCIVDDAYVYFRYVDNLLFLNNGLVYNQGEYVEGFSSPLWIILLTFFRLLHLNYWTIIRLISLVAFFVSWAFLVLLNRKLSEGQSKPYIVNYPLIHISFTYGVLCYFSSGLETPLVQMLSIVYACMFFFPQSRWLHVLVGISPLIRHELAVPYMIVFLWFVVSQKKFPWTIFLTCFVTLGGWVIFRIYYYADLFPNTFYLKDMTLIKQGMIYLYDAILPYFTVHILLGFLACFGFIKKYDKNYNLHTTQRIMMLIVGLSVAVYVVKIGGDPRHFRFLAFSYCIVMCATGGLIERLLVHLKLQKHTGAIFIFALIVALFTFTCFPRQLLTHPIFYEKCATLRPRNKDYHRAHFKIKDAMLHRVTTILTPPLLSFGSEYELRHEMRDLLNSKGKPPIFSGVVDGFSCVRAYNLFHKQYIHSLGLTEPFLARTNMRVYETAHKWGLRPLAKDIVKIRKQYGFKKGVFCKAVENNVAPKWIRNNLDTINVIERKVYNKHNFLENLGLALTKTGRISPKRSK